MSKDKELRSPERSEDIARNWNLVSVGSFATAALVGLVKTANDIRHQFYTTYVIGYDGRKTIFSDLIDRTKTKFASNETNFREGKIKVEAFTKTMHDIADERHLGVQKLLQEHFHIPTDNRFLDWTQGTAKRLGYLGRTNKVNAVMGFAGTATIALGAIAVLKHSSRILDAINQKIHTQQNSEQGR